MQNWRIVSRDGNPEKSGTYMTVLIHEENGQRYAVVETRYYANLDEEPDLKGWAMTGQPDHGLAWLEETGSYKDEAVYAWRELAPIATPPIPGDVIWLGIQKTSY